MNNRDYRIISKILQEISVIEDFITDFDFEGFTEDEKTKRAVCMTFINIGELTKSLTDDFRRTNTNVSWKGIAGMRDITAHKYQTLKMGDVWITITDDLPKLKEKLNEIIKAFETGN